METALLPLAWELLVFLGRVDVERRFKRLLVPLRDLDSVGNICLDQESD